MLAGAYDAMVARVIVWNGNVINEEDQYKRDIKIWDRSVTSGISQWNNYVNNEESIFLAI